MRRVGRSSDCGGGIECLEAPGVREVRRRGWVGGDGVFTAAWCDGSKQCAGARGPPGPKRVIAVAWAECVRAERVRARGGLEAC